MATPVQRATAILQACLDEAPDAAILGKVGDAFAYTYHRGETLTNNQKALTLIAEVRRGIKQVVQDAIQSQAAAAAAAAADSDIEIGSDGP